MRGTPVPLIGGAVLLLAALVAWGCDNSPGPSYVALGDSYAVGTGSTDPKTLGYAAVFHRWLQHNYDDRIELHNFAVNGETSASMMRDGQLRKALAFLEGRNGDDDPSNDVRIVSIGIGGNDLRDPIRSGGPCASPRRLTDRACVEAIAASAEGFRKNFPQILRALREAAGPDAIIFVTTYNNPYSGSGGPLDLDLTDAVLRDFNRRIEDEAAQRAVGARIVDFFAPFIGKSRSLTGLFAPREDFHPNNAGHRVMGQAMIGAFQREMTTGGASGARR